MQAIESVHASQHDGGDVFPAVAADCSNDHSSPMSPTNPTKAAIKRVSLDATETWMSEDGVEVSDEDTLRSWTGGTFLLDDSFLQQQQQSTIFDNLPLEFTTSQEHSERHGHHDDDDDDDDDVINMIINPASPTHHDEEFWMSSLLEYPEHTKAPTRLTSHQSRFSSSASLSHLEEPAVSSSGASTHSHDANKRRTDNGNKTLDEIWNERRTQLAASMERSKQSRVHLEAHIARRANLASVLAEIQKSTQQVCEHLKLDDATRKEKEQEEQEEQKSEHAHDDDDAMVIDDDDVLTTAMSVQV